MRPDKAATLAHFEDAYLVDVYAGAILNFVPDFRIEERPAEWCVGPDHAMFGVVPGPDQRDLELAAPIAELLKANGMAYPDWSGASCAVPGFPHCACRRARRRGHCAIRGAVGGARGVRLLHGETREEVVFERKGLLACTSAVQRAGGWRGWLFAPRRWGSFF